MRPLERCFHQYGQLLARHPWPFIIIPAVLTIVSSYGMLYFHSQDDIWDIYAPINGLSRKEELALKPFEYASGAHHHRMQILVNRKNGGNLLEKKYLEEISDAHKFIADNMTFFNGEKSFVYKEMCGIYCNESNAAVLAFLQTVIESRGESATVRLTFPNAEALQKSVFIGYSLGNLTYKQEPADEIDQAKLLILHYMVDLTLPRGKELAADFEAQLRTLFDEFTEESMNLKYSLLSRTRELEEQRKITLVAVPFLGLTTIVLTGFMLITLIDFPLYRSQHWESFIGVFSPGMALWTSAGFLFWAGFPFSNILTVVPFLVVTIGIDDAFLVLAGWRQSTKGASLEQRLGEAVAISGASVTVTSVTDVLSFAIGLFSNMPVVQLFCLYTTVALFVDYVYQMTFFTALMGLIVKKQALQDVEREKKLEKEEVSSIEKLKAKIREMSWISLISSNSGEKTEKNKLSKVDYYVSWLHTWTAQIFVASLFLTHISICSYYATEVNTDFDMENLYLADSPLTEISRKMQDFFLREAFVVNFAVRPLPDFSNETIRSEFEELVTKLEGLQYFGGGTANTNLWTRQFANAIAFWGEDEGFWDAPELLKNYREYGMEEKFIITRSTDDGEVIDGFFFSHTYRNMSSFLEVEKMMEQRRNILSSYSQFNISSHHPFEKVPTESAAAAPSNFIQTVVSAVILMSILVMLFVMNLEALISVVVSIVSICLGVIAYLHLWDVHLDAVSLISILMSIGFSVDYSAHVCYHYFAHAAQEEKESGSPSIENGSSPSPLPSTYSRIVSTLNGVGWPVIQSGLSTVIGMFPLMFIQAYVVAVFWKTVVLVSLLGMFHALLLLPVIFILTNNTKRLFCHR